ncbi:MAG: aldehyde dehydrogenase family protein [Gammaproteobacteria bacterium]|nr:MAG: aldehyde dehydrogenase family protein [Gammaproteobacteria bacterium]
MTITHLHFIKNQRVAPSDGRSIPLIDPSDGTEFAQIARGNSEDVNRAVAAARAAFGEQGNGPWGKLAPMERGRLLAKLAALVDKHRDELVKLESRDAGKPTRTALADVTALLRYCEFYSGAADKFYGDVIPYQSIFAVLVFREPHGVTGQIVPWNYPVQIMGRSCMPALAAGNTCVVKPSEDACLSILRVAELAAEAGFPPGAINVVTGYGHEAGAALSGHPDVDHISFTGSPDVGKLVARAAGEHHHPVTLELGGKSPQIVFADADLDAALPVIVGGIIQNCGQTCVAGSRVLVERPIYEQVIELLATKFRSLVAAPAIRDPDMGPLIRATQLKRVQDFVALAERDGIQVAARGTIAPDAPRGGFYHPAVLLRDVPHDHRLAQDELFGPVLSAMAFDTEDEAVRIANNTRFGLAAALWTRDGARQLRVARKLVCGQVFVNNFGAGGGVELPLGGVKHSGYGREKGMEALHGVTRVKTIVIKHD